MFTERSSLRVFVVFLGVNAVLRSLKFNIGDALLINTNTYGAVQDACRYVADRYGENTQELMLKYRQLCVMYVM